MSQVTNKPGLAGVALLALPLFFFLAVALKFGLGIGYLYDPLDAFFGPDPRSLRSILAQIVVFFGPIVALVVNIVPALRVSVGLEAGGLVSTLTIRGSFLSMATMAVSLFLIAVFSFYIITENAAEAAVRRYFGS